MTSAKLEELNQLLKQFAHIPGVETQFGFVPTAKMMLLDHIAQSSGHQRLYKQRVVTINNLHEAAAQWKVNNPNWYSLLRKLNHAQFVVSYCQLLAKRSTQVFHFCRNHENANKLIALAVSKGLTKRPLSMNTMKAAAKELSDEIARIAIEWIQLFQVGSPGQSPRRPPTPTSSPRTPMPSPKIIRKGTSLPIRDGIELLRSDSEAKSSKSDPGAKPDEPQFELGPVKLKIPKHDDITRYMADIRKKQKLTEEKKSKKGILSLFSKKGKTEEPSVIEFRFLPSCLEILTSCADWDYHMKKRIVELKDVNWIGQEWAVSEPEWAHDLKHLYTEEGKLEYCIQLYGLLEAIQSMCESNSFFTGISLLEIEGRRRRTRGMIRDMLFIDHEQIRYICRAVMRYTKII